MTNVNKLIFEQLIPVFQQNGMKLCTEKVIEWIDYNFNNGLDISYEEFLGVEVVQKPSLPKFSVIAQAVKEGVILLEQVKKLGGFK